MTKKARLVLEELCTVANAPETKAAQGYGFVDREDGSSIYVPKDIVAAANMCGEDVGQQARVKFTKIDSRHVAIRVHVMRDVDAAGGDQLIADALIDIEDAQDVVYDRLEYLRELLEHRGCAFPEEEVEEDTTQ